MIICRSKSDYY